MPYKKQNAIRSNKKYVIYDLMTDFGLNTQTFLQGCVSDIIEMVSLSTPKRPGKRQKNCNHFQTAS